MITRPVSEETARQASSSKVHPLSLWRAVILGLLLIPLNVFWVTIVEIRWYTLDGTSLPLFITPVFLLFILCGDLQNLYLSGEALVPRLSIYGKI